jgi:hypothetical protein
MPGKSILDARPAEIDRCLRTIQSGLEPVAQAAREQHEPVFLTEAVSARRDPPASAPVVPPDAAPVPKRLTADASAVADLVARLTALVELHEQLIASARDLPERRQPAAAGPSVGVSAGPFASTEALRRFERALQTLPEVRSVAVREYEGADRAILDVHLFQPTT